MNCVLAYGLEGFQSYPADMVISLSPEASFDFERQGVPYRLMSDFYRETDLFGQPHSKAYFDSQMEFMAGMDALFQRHSRICREFGIPLFSISFLKAKYAMDTVNVNGWIAQRFFDANPNINSLTLLMGHGAAGEISPSIFAFRASQKAVHAEVLKGICKRRQIQFKIIDAAAKQPSDSSASPSLRRQAEEMAKDWLKIPYYYLSYRKLFQSHAGSSQSLLFLHHGAYEIDHFIRQAVSNGIRVFVKEGHRIVLENSILRTAYAVDGEEQSGGLREELIRCAEEIRQGEGLWVSELNAACLWEGSADVLRPLFARYAENEAFHILSTAQVWKRCLVENRIDAILARGNTDPESLAILIAAKYLHSKKTICIQHAPSALEGEAMSVYDSVGFDYLLARDPVTHTYFKGWGRNESQLGWSGHYFNHLREKSRKQAGPRPVKIAYLPKKFHEGVRCLNEYSYPFTWYYEWQKRIMDLFASLKSHTFVYKHVSVQDWAARSILRYLQTLNASNIEIVEDPFSKILDQFDRVITDFPSGAFFESLACRKSVLCVHSRYFEINPEATRLFGQCLAPFDTIEESLAAIETFVGSDPDRYRAELPLKEMGLGQLLSKAMLAPKQSLAGVF
ncbi:MAG: hypothetical protein A3C47_04675 [Omnitrophica bacterium RIFCSPHIGHO2_02_FULL_51_18]|nr:MAG: hypothetical protein A3C47_04675 [Omnitrophica bacterium RIFCSPHIGHO2_02_FULL_51_18]